MDFINKEIVIPNIGKNYTKTWTPVAMTFFVFILTCNLLGLIPFFEFIKIGGGGGSTATGNFGVTLGLATITFFAIIIAGVKKHGFIGHWKNMVPSGVPAPVLIILIPIGIILVDQTGLLIKKTVLRPRPFMAMNPEDINHLVKPSGLHKSFPSNHAANNALLAMV